MKDWIIALIVGLLLIVFGMLSFITINNSKKEIIIQKDTVMITAPDYNLLIQNDSLWSVNDSLTQLNLKYEEELNIALFKLDRIKEYNRIAASGNNIKYLRGWINRTLNE